jgi:hypothetical protein
MEKFAKTDLDLTELFEYTFYNQFSNLFKMKVSYSSGHQHIIKLELVNIAIFIEIKLKQKSHRIRKSGEILS